MKTNIKFFNKTKSLPIDKFFNNVLYDKKNGYYNSKIPLGLKGDFITAPHISHLFSEMIAIWMVSTWEKLGKPKNFNIIELGPGDGSLIKILIKVFKKFPKFNRIKKIYLLEISNFLKKVQKEKICKGEVKWIKDLKHINKGPVIFFGNEYFDAIPIKQFKFNKNILFEKFYLLKENNKIKETFKRASTKDVKIIKSYDALKNLQFIEYPKFGLKELEKIIKKISKLNGCLLMIDYGYLKPSSRNTLQSVMRHKKNYVLDNLGEADITSHVNFALLKEFFLKNNLKVKNTITQKEFLKNMGILDRAELLAKKMKFSDQSNLYLRLKRLLSPGLMGELFKVILAYKFKNDDYFGFN